MLWEIHPCNFTVVGIQSSIQCCDCTWGLQPPPSSITPSQHLRVNSSPLEWAAMRCKALPWKMNVRSPVDMWKPFPLAQWNWIPAAATRQVMEGKQTNHLSKNIPTSYLWIFQIAFPLPYLEWSSFLFHPKYWPGSRGSYVVSKGVRSVLISLPETVYKVFPAFWLAGVSRGELHPPPALRSHCWEREEWRELWRSLRGESSQWGGRWEEGPVVMGMIFSRSGVFPQALSSNLICSYLFYSTLVYLKKIQVGFQSCTYLLSFIASV